jgi:hypothetical protein
MLFKKRPVKKVSGTQALVLAWVWRSDRESPKALGSESRSVLELERELGSD